MAEERSWRDWARIRRVSPRRIPGLPLLRGGVRSWGRMAVEFIYPPQCRLCSIDLSEQEPAETLFCAACRTGLESSCGPMCRRCGAAIGPYVDPEARCPYCAADSFAFESVARLGVYDGAIREAVLRGKRRGGDGLLVGLAELQWRHMAPLLQTFGIDVVIPIPLHSWQGLLRPHNPAAILAEVWGKRLNVPTATHILRKQRWTEAQARLSPTQRRVNVRDAFTIVPGTLPTGSTVLLADDVLTTGTTAHEAARVLRRNGASRVVVAVVARGLGRRT